MSPLPNCALNARGRHRVGPVGRRPNAALLLCVLLLGVLTACASRPPAAPSTVTVDPALYGYATAEDPWGPYIRAASHRFDVPELWIRTVMQIESGGRTTLNGRPITSHAGAMGLMQVMPATFSELRRKHQLGPNPHDPYTNIMAGTAYIREMYELYGSPGFLAAYNCGPGCYGDYLAGSRRLPMETQNYLAKGAHRVAAAQPRVQVASAFAPAAPRPAAVAKMALPAVQPPRVMAAVAPAPVPVATGTWGIQVGAFSTPDAGQRAASDARLSVPDLLGAASIQIEVVETSAGTLYRARLMGITEHQASAACQMLAGRGAACVRVSGS